MWRWCCLSSPETGEGPDADTAREAALNDAAGERRAIPLTVLVRAPSPSVQSETDTPLGNKRHKGAP